MEEGLSPKKIISWSFAVFLFALVAFVPHPAFAASLYLSPGSSEKTVGQEFSLTVGVNSPDKPVNAVSGKITFPADLVEVTSVSKSGSILSLWVNEPSFSNSAGTINFEGIILNPGYTGSAGKVATINFKTKAAGSCVVAFASGSVLANDGKGTNITSGLGRSTIAVNEKAAPSETLPPPTSPSSSTSRVAGTPPNPALSSSSHPDQDAWYGEKIADIHWSLPAGVTGVSYSLTHQATTPGTVSDGLFDSYSSKALTDGVWYFNLRFRNAAGWGGASHYRIQIDTVPPVEFMIRLIEGPETSNPRPTIIFNTSDALSGIHHYTVKVGNSETIEVAPSEIMLSNPYVLPEQDPGEHRILVVAYDKAGNHASSSAEFVVDTLLRPTITDYPERLHVGSRLIIMGKSAYPNTTVLVWVETNGRRPESMMVKTDEDGNFLFVDNNRVSDSVYKVWAQLVDDKGAKSPPSDIVTVVVEEPYFFKFGQVYLDWYYAVALVILIIVLHWLVIWRYIVLVKSLRRKIDRKAEEAEEELHHNFDCLKSNLGDKIRTLEVLAKSRRTPELNKKMVKELEKDLQLAEKNVKSKISRLKKGRKGE